MPRRRRRRQLETLKQIKARRWEKQKGRCHYCGKEMSKREATIEHVVPVSRGGPVTDRRNIVLACEVCNKRKGNRILEEMPKKE